MAAIKANQQKIEMVLQGKKVQYEIRDVASDESVKNEMREKCGDNHALPPQIFNGSTHCGGFKEFEEAIECETLDTFLKLK